MIIEQYSFNEKKNKRLLKTLQSSFILIVIQNVIRYLITDNSIFVFISNHMHVLYT